MIVGLDVSAIPTEPRGAGTYVIELVRALAARGAIEIRLEARRGDAERWKAVAPGAAVHAVVPDSRVRRLAWEQIAAPRFVDRWGVDVFHGPHYTMPEIAKRPKVVTIHDLTFFDHPEWHERVKVAFFTRAIRVAAERADALVCVSTPTARRLQDLLAPRAPVHVIPHGIDHTRFRPDDASGADAAHLAPLGLAPGVRYVAFAATIEPRKDVTTLVHAFERIAADLPDVVLAIAGGSGWGSDAFEAAVAASPVRDRILRLGYVAHEALPAFIRNAAVFVYAALEEGFGLPVLESLACGTPTVTSAGSVMDELAEGAAHTVEPGNAAELARLLGELLLDGREGAHAERGIEVARRYTWDAAAAAHEQVYASVVPVNAG